MQRRGHCICRALILFLFIFSLFILSRLALGAFMYRPGEAFETEGPFREGGGRGDPFLSFWAGVLNADFLATTLTTSTLMDASEEPAMLCALQRYSPASPYEIPFRLMTDHRRPTCGEFWRTEGLVTQIYQPHFYHVYFSA